MADPLAITAAVVQFLDIAVRLSIKLSWVCSEMQDVPQWLHRLKSDLDQQIAVAKFVQSNPVHTLVSPSTSTSIVTPIDGPLRDYLRIMEDLLDAVQTLSSDKNTGKLAKSWKSLLTVHKRREILTLCQDLEQKRSTISLWLGNASVTISSEIKGIVRQMQPDTGQILSLSKKHDQEMSTLSNQVSHMASLVRSIDQTCTTAALVTNNDAATQQQVLRRMDDTIATASLLMQEFQKVQSLSSDNQTRMIGSRDLVVDQHPPTNHEPSREMTILPSSYAQPGSTRLPCGCRKFHQASQTQICSGLQIRRILQREHYRQCSRLNCSEQSLQLLLRIILPSWILSHIIHLGMIITWGSNTGWRLSPIVIGASRVVNPRESPGFRAVDQLDYLLRSHAVKANSSCFNELQMTLRDLFQSREASALDEDCRGYTLLYRTIDLCSYWLLGDISESAGRALMSLVQYLLECGANPNVLSSAQISDMGPERGGTALDMYASAHIRTECVTETLEDTMKGITSSLVDHGGQFSGYFNCLYNVDWDTYCADFEKEVEGWCLFPERAEACGLSELSIAVLGYSEERLTRAIRKGNLEFASPKNGFRALHLAIFWPFALRKLLEAGADIECQDQRGRRPIYLAVGCQQAEAAHLLFDADCALNTPDDANTLLEESLLEGYSLPESLQQESLQQEPDFDNVTTQVIDAMIDRHTRFRKFALSVLPNYSESRKHLVEGQIDPVLASKVSKELETCGHVIPSALELDAADKSVYYDMSSFTRSDFTRPDLVPFAERLWTGGFRQINEYDPHTGLTPVLLNWHLANFDMIHWFLGKGVSIFDKHRDKPVSGLHIYAARAHTDVFDVRAGCGSDLVRELMKDEESHWDSCGCLCTPLGCTPLSVLIKSPMHWIRPSVHESHSKGGYESVLRLFYTVKGKLLYTPEQDSSHTEQLLRSLTFEMSHLQHTCCHIAGDGSIGDWGNSIDAKSKVDTDSPNYSNSVKAFEERLEEGRRRLLKCHCSLAEKPICAVFNEVCVGEA